MIRIHFPKRKATDARVPDFTVAYNDASMTVDMDTLPAPLYRLLPVPLARAKDADWTPFCVMATAMGLMK